MLAPLVANLFLSFRSLLAALLARRSSTRPALALPEVAMAESSAAPNPSTAALLPLALPDDDSALITNLRLPNLGSDDELLGACTDDAFNGLPSPWAPKLRWVAAVIEEEGAVASMLPAMALDFWSSHTTQSNPVFHFVNSAPLV